MLTRLKFEIQRSPKKMAHMNLTTVRLRLDQIGFDRYFIDLQEKFVFVLSTCQRELELASIRVFSY